MLVDVGEDRVGDILGAQFVALVVYTLAAPRAGLLVGAVVAAGAATFALRLRWSYTSALATTLIAGAGTPDAIAVDPALVYESERWLRLLRSSTVPNAAVVDLPTRMSYIGVDEAAEGHIDHGTVAAGHEARRRAGGRGGASVAQSDDRGRARRVPGVAP